MRVPGGPDQKFQCPICGGSSFGSVLLEPDKPVTSVLHRYCHGNDAGDGLAGCTFNWLDEDDWRYFLVDGERLTKEEFAAVEEQIRRIPVEGKPYWPGETR